MALRLAALMATLAAVVRRCSSAPGPASTVPAPPVDLMTPVQRAWLVSAGKDRTPGAFPAMTGSQAARLFEAEEEFDRVYYSYHQAWGQYANPHYKSKTDRSTVLSWDELGDSACWSGHQLAALAHRWNATEDLRTLGRINTALAAFENLTQVSGKPGFMARFMGPADDKPYQVYYCLNSHNCSAAHGDAWFHGAQGFEGWVFLDSLSRDAYFGAALGLVSVLRKVLLTATLWRIPTAAVSSQGLVCVLRKVAYSCNPMWIIPTAAASPLTAHPAGLGRGDARAGGGHPEADGRHSAQGNGGRMEDPQ